MHYLFIRFFSFCSCCCYKFGVCSHCGSLRPIFYTGAVLISLALYLFLFSLARIKDTLRLYGEKVGTPRGLARRPGAIHLRRSVTTHAPMPVCILRASLRLREKALHIISAGSRPLCALSVSLFCVRFSSKSPPSKEALFFLSPPSASIEKRAECIVKTYINTMYLYICTVYIYM